jgi:hypothetical protein
VIALAKAFPGTSDTGMKPAMNPAKVRRMEEVVLAGAELDFNTFSRAFLGNMASKYPRLVDC